MVVELVGLKREAAIDGASLALPIALATLGALAGLRPRAGHAATGRLDLAEGERCVGEVVGEAEKLATLGSPALQALLCPRGPGWVGDGLVPVAPFDEAVTHAFDGDVAAAIRDTLRRRGPQFASEWAGDLARTQARDRGRGAVDADWAKVVVAGNARRTVVSGDGRAARLWPWWGAQADPLQCAVHEAEALDGDVVLAVAAPSVARVPPGVIPVVAVGRPSRWRRFLGSAGGYSLPTDAPRLPYSVARTTIHGGLAGLAVVAGAWLAASGAGPPVDLAEMVAANGPDHAWRYVEETCPARTSCWTGLAVALRAEGHPARSRAAWARGMVGDSGYAALDGLLAALVEDGHVGEAAAVAAAAGHVPADRVSATAIHVALGDFEAASETSAPALAPAMRAMSGRAHLATQTTSVAPVDADGDGVDEVVVATRQNLVRLDGGAFDEPTPVSAAICHGPLLVGPKGSTVVCTTDDAADQRTLTVISLATGEAHAGPRVSDDAAGGVLTPDGLVVSLQGDGSTWRWSGDWPPVWEPLPLTRGSSVRGLALLDVDGDGREELIQAAGEWGAYDLVALSLGAERVRWAARLPGARYDAVTVFERDGRPGRAAAISHVERNRGRFRDFPHRGGTPGIEWVELTGAGLEHGPTLPAPCARGWRECAVVHAFAGDLDGDGRVELVAAVREHNPLGLGRPPGLSRRPMTSRSTGPGSSSPEWRPWGWRSWTARRASRSSPGPVSGRCSPWGSAPVWPRHPTREWGTWPTPSPPSGSGPRRRRCGGRAAPAPGAGGRGPRRDRGVGAGGRGLGRGGGLAL